MASADVIAALNAEKASVQARRAAAVAGGKPTQPFDDNLANITVELARLTNVDTLAQRMVAAQTANATFLALGSATPAQVGAQVRALTRQMNAFIRLNLNDLADVSDT